MARYCITCVKNGNSKPTTATYNKKNEQPLYCKIHSSTGMVNTKDPMCKKCGNCKPSYNVPGLKAIYCEGCKEPGMVNVGSKKCIDCKICKPSFNLPGKAPDYCGECSKKYNGMVNVNNKKCAHTLVSGDRCANNPLFNLPGKKGGVYCSSHAPVGYIDVFHSKCIYKDGDDKQCTNSPSYNYKGLKELLYCSTHSLDGMIDVKHPLCKLCKLIYVNESNNYDGMCISCYSFTNPDEPVVRNFLVKERFIVNYFKTTHPEYTWKYNKFINTCTKYRPDLLLDIGSHVVIIEIDEHQHDAQNYKDCDLKRSLDILSEIARPLIMLRINPDKFVSKNGTKNKPMFKTVKKQLVLDTNVWNERKAEIDACFEKCITKPTELFTQVNLFFDS